MSRSRSNPSATASADRQAPQAGDHPSVRVAPAAGRPAAILNPPGAVDAERAANAAAALVMHPSTPTVGTPSPLQTQGLDGFRSRVSAETGGSGVALDASTRNFMEDRFGADFSSIRVHSGEQASASALRRQTNAFAFGHDLVFAEGAYQPGTLAGRTLIAHELTHVLQQDGRPAQVQRNGNEAAELGKFSEPQEIGKWRKTLEGKGYKVYTSSEFGDVPWLKKAFPHKNRRPDMVAVKDGKVLVGDVTAGPWSEADMRAGDKRTLPNELAPPGGEKQPHLNKTIDDAKQLARNLPKEMQGSEVTAQERWWKKGGYSKEVQVKAPGAKVEVPAAPPAPKPLPKTPPGRIPAATIEGPPASRLDSGARGTSGAGAAKGFKGPGARAGAGAKGRGAKPRGGGPKGGHPLIAIGPEVEELLLGDAKRQAAQEEMEREIEKDVRIKLAGMTSELAALLEQDPKEIYATVTVVISQNNMMGGQSLESVTVALGTRKGEESKSEGDGIFFTENSFTYSFKLLDVAEERERQQREEEQRELSEKLRKQAKDREAQARQAQAGKGPQKPAAEEPAKKDAGPPAASPPALNPAAQPQAPALQLIPGMGSSDPIRDAAAWTSQARAYARQLVARGESLRSNGGSADQRRAWKVAVNEWITATKYMRNWFKDQSRSEAVNACNEMFDTEGRRMREIWETL